MRWYIGWDQRDVNAYEVCRLSLLKHASIPIEVLPLKEWELRAKGLFWRDYYVSPNGQMWDLKDNRPFSTNFSYTRFCIPMLEKFGDEVVGFCDADMLFRADTAPLLESWEGSVACVKHEHVPNETIKMTGNIQQTYERKNWSSFMLFRPSRCTSLTPFAVNNMNRDWLHGFRWLNDSEIFGLSEKWNWLEGYSNPEIDPKVVHHTRGTPDMPGYEDVAYQGEWWEVLSKHFSDKSKFQQS